MKEQKLNTLGMFLSWYIRLFWTGILFVNVFIFANGSYLEFDGRGVLILYATITFIVFVLDVRWQPVSWILHFLIATLLFASTFPILITFLDYGLSAVAIWCVMFCLAVLPHFVLVAVGYRIWRVSKYS